jgi:hypothetical protein
MQWKRIKDSMPAQGVWVLISDGRICQIARLKGKKWGVSSGYDRSLSDFPVWTDIPLPPKDILQS